MVSVIVESASVSHFMKETIAKNVQYVSLSEFFKGVCGGSLTLGHTLLSIYNAIIQPYFNYLIRTYFRAYLISRFCRSHISRDFIFAILMAENRKRALIFAKFIRINLL